MIRDYNQGILIMLPRTEVIEEWPPGTCWTRRRAKGTYTGLGTTWLSHCECCTRRPCRCSCRFRRPVGDPQLEPEIGHAVAEQTGQGAGAWNVVGFASPGESQEGEGESWADEAEWLIAKEPDSDWAWYELAARRWDIPTQWILWS